jgi:dephospho-CoA kinase
MIIFGLTGNIGCGKSTVSTTFINHGIKVIDADQVARDVVVPHSIGLTQIIDAFGLRFLKNNGTLDRVALGSLVFSDYHAMEQLNAIMGPLIQEESQRQFNILQQAGHTLVGWDGALIIEGGHAYKYKPLIVVHCTLEQQVERLLVRGLTRDEAVARINCQMPTAHKLQMADFAIDTSQDKEYSVKQTEIIISYLKKLTGELK